MHQFSEAKKIRTDTKDYKYRNIMAYRLLHEQRKLEVMVMEHLEKGNDNLGTNLKIIEQSARLDRLVVAEMMLDEMGY